MRRQDIGGQEGHPLEQVGHVLLDIAGDDVALALQIGDRRPDEGHRIPGLRIGDPLQVPDDVLRRHGLAVLPFCAFAHFHADSGLVVVGPAPFGQQAGPEAQVGILVDILIEHAFVDRHELRVDRRQAGRRVPGRQRHMVGDGQRVADGGCRLAVEQQRAEAGGGGRARGTGDVQELPAVEMGHGCLPSRSVLSQEARLTDRSGLVSGIDRAAYSAASAGALAAQRCISVLDGLLSSSILSAVATPATGRSFGSSAPIWTRTEAWSQ